MLDQALSALITDLHQRGLLDETLVVLASEFGRTPNINKNQGRDHHPTAFSAVLAGGGIRGGQVYGRSDAQGMRVEENAVTIPDLNATVAAALGLDIQQTTHNDAGRPFTVADKGRPIWGVIRMKSVVITLLFAGSLVAFDNPQVHQLLAERCVSCHGPDKIKGGLKASIR